MSYKIILRYYRSVIIAIIILILTTIPGNDLKPIVIFPIPHLDKAAHFFVFMILSIFLFADIKRNNKQFSNTKVMLLVFLISLFYGVIIELTQLFIVINRSAEIYDLVANTLGIITGCLLQIQFRIIRY